MAFAHEQGVIHRDIKPSNLLLDRQGKLFVADFGLARLETDVSLTRTGDLLGTPRYMSPEQASGSSKQLDPRTDIYSLGATLYEMLTLRPVISGPSRAAAIRQLQDLQVAAPRTHDANIPKPLEQIVLKCLQPHPIDRYKMAGALAEDLGRFLGSVATGLNGPQGLTFGSDGSLYIANTGTDEVLRYDGSSVTPIVSAASGGLDNPRNAVFAPDPDGTGPLYPDLYVASYGTGQILRYDGKNGAPKGVFATKPVGDSFWWLEFGTDGYLSYISTMAPQIAPAALNPHPQVSF
ncbi:MAG: serine/threonine-protein kinase [Pirellula sp.]